MRESIHSLFGSDLRHRSGHLVLALGWMPPKAEPKTERE